MEIKSVKKTRGTSNLKPRSSNADRFYCESPVSNITEFSQLMDWLPSGYSYHVCKYVAVGHFSDHTDFEAVIRISLKTVDGIKEWLKSMPVIWRIDHTRPTKGQKIIFKADYRCHHNTKPRGTLRDDRSSKNTNCPAKMKISLLRTQVYHGRQSRSTDPHVPEYPTIVSISSIHNHSIYVSDAVCHRDAINTTNDLPEIHEHDTVDEDLNERETLEEAGFDEEWDAMCQELSAMVHSQKELQGAASAFIKSFNKIKYNPSVLSSALHMFGRYETTTPGSKRARALTKSLKHGGPTEAQPTSVPHHRTKMEGRQRLPAKKLLKTTDIQDHRYSHPKNCRELQSNVLQQP